MAQSALTWNHSLPPGAVRASVAAGWLTLSGEVRWHYQRQDAANCVRDLPGIVGVSDCITLKRRHRNRRSDARLEIVEGASKGVAYIGHVGK